MSEYEDFSTQVDGVEPVVEPVVEETPAEVVAEDPTPEAAEVEAEESEDHPKKKSGSQRAREKAMRLEIENQYLKEQLAGKPAVAAPAEDEDTFTSDILKKAEARVLARLEAERVKTAWADKVRAGQAKFSDFQEALQDAESPSELVAKRLISDKTPVEVVYHLATHETEYRAINALTDPDDVADAMADLKARVLNASKPKQTTKAPPPIAPVASSGIKPPAAIHPRFEEF